MKLQRGIAVAIFAMACALATGQSTAPEAAGHPVVAVSVRVRTTMYHYRADYLSRLPVLTFKFVRSKKRRRVQSSGRGLAFEGKDSGCSNDETKDNSGDCGQKNFLRAEGPDSATQLMPDDRAKRRTVRGQGHGVHLQGAGEHGQEPS